MDVYEAVEARCSVRSYQDRPIEEDKLQRILNAARLAPSARNRQEWKFVVVRDDGLRKALAEASEQPFVAEAPIVLAGVSTEPTHVMSCGVASAPVDCAIALEHIALAAAAEGLGTCWIGHFFQDQARKILHVPDSMQIIELMPLGYPAPSEGPRRPRKALEEVVSYDGFQ